MARMTDTEAMNMYIPFGKFSRASNRKTLEEIPSDYLQWFENQDWCDNYPELLEAVGRVLRWRTKNNGHF